MGLRIAVANDPPVGQQVVGGVQLALCVEIGGGNGIGGGVADGHEVRVFHGGLGNKVHIPGRGVVLGVMEAVGVDEVGVLTAQIRRLGVHGCHKGGHGAGDRLRQNVAGLVGGDHQHAVQQVPYRHGLTDLDAGGTAVRGQTLQGGGGGSQLLVHGQLPRVDGLQGQQGCHDFGQAGGIQLLVLALGVDHRAGIGVHQQGGLGQNVGISGKLRLFVPGGICGGKQTKA